MCENGLQLLNKDINQDFLQENHENAVKKEDTKEIRKLYPYWSDRIACVFFGMGTWLPINTVFAQIPNLTQTTPESWSLPSYVVVIIQVANILPALFSCNRKRLTEHNTKIIPFFLILSIVSLLCLAFTFQIVVYPADHPYSLYLFTFTLLMAFHCCCSILLFLPFMASLPEQYLIPYFVGEGLSATVPGILALLQTLTQTSRCASSNSKLRIRQFFLFGAFFMFLSTCSFFHLNKHAERRQFDKPKTTPRITEKNQKLHFVLLLVLQSVFSCIHFGVISGLQSYSCLSYGEIVYNLSVNINQVSDSIFIYLLSFCNLLSINWLLTISSIEMILVVYLVLTAFMSPTPPLVQTLFGSIHIILGWAINSMFLSYIKLSIAAIFRNQKPDDLFYYGAVTQAGAFVGATSSFLLINFTKLLYSKGSETQSCN